MWIKRSTVLRNEAIKSGLPLYFTGKPCIHGHICGRTIKGGKCVECQTEYRKKWVKDNWDKKYKSNKKYAQSNLEKMREYKRKWKEKNKDLVRKHCLDRISKKRNAQGKYTTQEIRDLMSKQHEKCAACNCCIKNNYHADHIFPLSRGGSNFISNIQLLCPKCNTSKANKTMEEWKNAKHN